jgi:glucose-6-phosphate-specific signal transduction histidine kinase
MLSIEVSDDGRGLSADALAKAGSFGIRGLRERAETVSGWVDLSSGTSGPKSGTTIILSVQVSQAQRARAAARVLISDDDDDQQHDPSAWGSDL